MRGKEEAHDYRYFPCPDLVPVEIDDAWIEAVRATLPELPDARRLRFIADYGLPEHDAGLLTASRELADYFEKAAAACNQAKKVSNWIMTELTRELKGEELSTCKIAPEQLGALVTMVEAGTISGKIAKGVFLEMMASGKSPEAIVQEQNLGQVSNEDELLAIVRRIVADNPGQVADFMNGKTKLMSYFVGQLMQKTKGQANPALANKLFTQELAGQ
jgi:aspartyl-tRNA(Asn)/glutamyl-tRNA(Gln) amidotransferase subunit B